MRFEYTIPEAVKVNTEGTKVNGKYPLQLTIPMLSGFEFPVENLSFLINMPAGSITRTASYMVQK